MKIRTSLAALAGAGVGYVLGARAGQERFEQIKAQAQRIVSDPEVRQKVADLPTQVKENLPKASGAVSDAVKSASDKVQGVKDKAGKSDSSSPTVTPTFDVAEVTDPVTTDSLSADPVGTDPLVAEPLGTETFETETFETENFGTEPLGSETLEPTSFDGEPVTDEVFVRDATESSSDDNTNRGF